MRKLDVATWALIGLGAFFFVMTVTACSIPPRDTVREDELWKIMRHTQSP